MVYNFVRLYPISSCMMFFRMGQTDENGTQHRKHISLDESHQQFQTVHENHEQEAHNGQGGTNHSTQLARDEYHTGERKNNSVSTHHVGEKTHHQSERFGEDAKQFYHRHHGNRHLEPRWYWRPKYLLPILFVSKQIDEQHGAYGKEEGNVNVTRNVCTAGKDWYQS